MKRIVVALGLVVALSLPAYTVSHVSASSPPTSQGALVITNGFCGYGDFVVNFSGGGSQDFGSTSGSLTYVANPGGTTTFQCIQTLDNPALAPSQTLLVSTTCQIDGGPLLNGLAILTKSGMLETTCHGNYGWTP